MINTPINAMQRRPAAASAQESINLQRAAAVYGNRVFIPVTSKAAPNPNNREIMEKKR